MKLIRRDVLAIISASFLSVFGSGAMAAVGPTIKCTRVGQRIVFRGYTYSCVKSKGKLVWKKRAKVVAPTDSASVGASPKSSASQTSSALTFVAKTDEVVEGETKLFIVKPEMAMSFPVLAARISGTVVVLNAICTHAGCVVEAENGKIICPCHLSSFNAMTGKVIKGVAKKALRKYVASEDAGSVFIKL